MGIFGSKKKKEEKTEEAPRPAAEQKKQARTAGVPGVKDVLVRPRVTEKAAHMTSANVYTFDVRKTATKKDIAAAVVALYKVTPVKVRIVHLPAKRVAMRRKRGFGTVSSVKKAYVSLKEGESITFA